MANNVEGGSMGLMERLVAEGWEIREGDTTALVPVSAQGLLHCVDGRLGDHSGEAMRGPKIQGGIFGVAALMGDCSREGFEKAIEKTREVGITPSVHEDDHHGPTGCGFARLLSEGELSGLPKLEVSIAEVGEMVKAAGGEVVTLTGAHAEQVVRVNLRPGTTIEPDGNGFILDAWVANDLEINQDRLMENAIETVVKLNGPRVIEVFK